MTHRDATDAPPTDALARYGWASARLSLDPDLLVDWASSPDRAIRRAVMRSPRIDEHIVDILVSNRRSGMHTLGENPATPPEYLRDNPSAMRRWERITRIAPRGRRDVDDDPNRTDLVDAGSPTVDLLVAESPATTLDTAIRLVDRPTPPADPWALALLLARFGDDLEVPLGRHSRSRVAAARSLTVDASQMTAR